MSVPILPYRSTVQDLYGWALSSAYATDTRVLRSDWASMSDPDLYEKLLKDPVVAHAINQRLHGIAGRRFRLLAGATPGQTPDDPAKAYAAGGEECFSYWEGSHEALRQAAIAVMLGESIAQIHGERRRMSVGGGPELDWWCPTYLKGFGQFRSRWKPVHSQDAEGHSTFDIHRELWSVERRKWEEVLPEEEAFLLKVIYEDEETRLHYGRGLANAIYNYLFLKEQVLDQGMDWMERFANGMVTVQIDGYQNLVGSPEISNASLTQSWLNVWNQWRSKYILPYGRGQEVKVWETNGQGWQAMMELIRYFDDAITALILGSLRPFGKGEGGTYGQGKVEEGQHESLVQFDRDKVNEDVTRDLVGLWCRLNRENILAMGWGQAKSPRFEITIERNIDPEVAMNTAKAMHEMGADISLTELYQVSGLFTKPAPGTEVLPGRDQTAPDPFGGFGGFGGESPKNPDEQKSAGEQPGAEERDRQLEKKRAAFRAFIDERLMALGRKSA